MGQKVALLDVCDVSCDLHRSVIELAHLNIDLANVKDWDIFNTITDDERERVLKLFNEQDFWRNLPPVPNVHEGIEGLKREGYIIRWVTSPWFTCENWEGIRRTWLNEQFGTHPLDITFTSEKFRVRGDILIDDRPKHVSLWQAAHPEGKAFLFDSPFNRYFEWNPRGIWAACGIKAV